MTPIFAAESIGKSFRGRPVLTAASVWACPGRITVLLGRNGCGKTTLLRIGAGVLAPDHGVVRFAGEAYERPRLDRLARQGLFYLPDRALLSRRLTLRHHFQAMRWSFGSLDVARIAGDLDVRRFLDERTDTLSRGERRRAEIALAVARSPLCLLADEPITEVGPNDAATIAAALRQLARRGTATVLTGHEVPDLLALADDVVWMTAGTTHGLGSPTAATTHDQFRREYLGPTRK